LLHFGCSLNSRYRGRNGVPMTESNSRRTFLATTTFAIIALVLRGRPLWAAPAPRRSVGDHPTPRPGITADKVPRKEQLADDPDAIPVFDMVREIPGVIDGIRCNCGCAELKDYYSLLTCYEGADAMARHCEVCQGQGRLAYRLHKSGKSLDEIRKGIDARFG
jgi:hypothetical protein